MSKVFMMPKYIEINDDTLPELREALSAVDIVAVDTETTELIKKKAKSIKGKPIVDLKPYLFSLAWRVGKEVKRAAGNFSYMPLLWDILMDKIQIYHNAKFDMHVLHAGGIDPLNVPLIIDTMAYARAYGIEEQMSLDALIKKFEIGPGKKYNTKIMTVTDEIYRDTQLDYASADTYYTYLLYEYLDKSVYAEFPAVYAQMIFPLMCVLYKMEQRGVSIDSALLNRYTEEIKLAEQRVQAEFNAEVGAVVNIKSGPQMKHLLFDQLNLPVIKRSAKTEEPTLDEETVLLLAKDYPIMKKVVDYRKLDKHRSTYTEGLVGWLAEDNKVHTTFNLTGARTWRLSSSSPNLQNVTAHPDKIISDWNVRAAFVANPGKVLIDMDYAQIELRVLAALSGDTTMMNLINDGVDLHAYLASQVKGSYEDFMDAKKADSSGTATQFQLDLLELRSQFKRVNFGVVYGIGPKGLSGLIGLPEKNAQYFIDTFMKTFPNVGAFIRYQHEFARYNGYVELLGGFRRYIPDINSNSYALRGSAERAAQNSPVQGSAAYIINAAMIEIDKYLVTNALEDRVKMLLQIHDEVLFEADESIAESMLPIIVNIAENAYVGYLGYALPVKIAADIKIAKTWRDAH